MRPCRVRSGCGSVLEQVIRIEVLGQTFEEGAEVLEILGEVVAGAGEADAGRDAATRHGAHHHVSITLFTDQVCEVHQVVVFECVLRTSVVAFEVEGEDGVSFASVLAIADDLTARHDQAELGDRVSIAVGSDAQGDSDQLQVGSPATEDVAALGLHAAASRSHLVLEHERGFGEGKVVIALERDGGVQNPDEALVFDLGQGEQASDSRLDGVRELVHVTLGDHLGEMSFGCIFSLVIES